MSVSSVFLLLLIHTVGNGWALFFPKRSWVVGTRLESLGPVLDFINPGPFSIKEVNRLLNFFKINHVLITIYNIFLSTLLLPWLLLLPGVGGGMPWRTLQFKG